MWNSYIIKVCNMFLPNSKIFVENFKEALTRLLKLLHFSKARKNKQLKFADYFSLIVKRYIESFHILSHAVEIGRIRVSVRFTTTRNLVMNGVQFDYFLPSSFLLWTSTSFSTLFSASQALFFHSCCWAGTPFCDLPCNPRFLCWRPLENL